jgi:AraC family transcriptional regulator
MLLVGLARRHPCGEIAGIPAQWMVFAPHIGRIPGQLGPTTFGAVSGQASNGFDYFAGVRVAAPIAPPDGLSLREIAAGRHAVFEHRGAVATLAQTCDAIFRDWLPRSGETATGDPDLIELYGEEFDIARGQGLIEIRVPLAPKA